MKSVALYSPYIPKHAGGGERYLLSIAEICSWSTNTSLLVESSQVESTKRKLETYQTIFGLNLSRVQVLPTVIGTGKNPIKTALETRKFDVLFAQTDGSIFPSMAKKSYLIMQVPWTRSLSLAEQIKVRSFSKIIVYSSFVAKVLSQSWGIQEIGVLHPYVDTRDFHPVEVALKEKLIINVGRFFSHAQSNSKRQDILISAFAKMLEKQRLKGWHLALLGNVDPNKDSQEFIKKLKEMARGLPVSIHTDLSYDELRAFYSRASIYWHAAGFGIDEKTHPENTEHFGITTLEAMSSGCVPFVVPKGGQREVVGDERLFWETEDELVEKTSRCILSMGKEQKEWQKLSTEMFRKCEPYSKAVFEQEIGKYL